MRTSPDPWDPLAPLQADQKGGMGIIWTIIIGFVAGVIAKFITPGKNEPSGFILTTILGIVGAFVATFLGQSLGWYRPGEGAGLIGAVVGAVIVLLIWGIIAARRARGPNSSLGPTYSRSIRTGGELASHGRIMSAIFGSRRGGLGTHLPWR